MNCIHMLQLRQHNLSVEKSHSIYNKDQVQISDLVLSEFHGRIEINVRFLDITEVQILKILH